MNFLQVLFILCNLLGAFLGFIHAANRFGFAGGLVGLVVGVVVANVAYFGTMLPLVWWATRDLRKKP